MTYKFSLEIEVEGSDADDAEDILREILDSEPAIMEYDLKVFVG